MSWINLGGKIKAFRKLNNLTQQELADKLGISRSTLSYYEKGTVEPNIYTLLKLSEVMNCSLDYLFDIDNRNNTFEYSSYIKQIDDTLNDNDISSTIKLLKNLLKKVDRTFIELEQSKKRNDLIYAELKRTKNRVLKIDELFDKLSDIENILLKNDNEFAEEICPNVIDLQEYKDKVKNVKCRMTPICGDVSAGEPCYAEEELIDIIPIPEDLLCSSKEYFILNIKGDSMNELFEPKELVLVEHTHYISNNDIAIVLVGTDEATIKKVSFDGDYITLIPMSTNPIHKPKTHHIKDVCIQGKVVGKLFDVLRPSL